MAQHYFATACFTVCKKRKNTIPQFAEISSARSFRFFFSLLRRNCSGVIDSLAVIYRCLSFTAFPMRRLQCNALTFPPLVHSKKPEGLERIGPQMIFLFLLTNHMLGVPCLFPPTSAPSTASGEPSECLIRIRRQQQQ